MLEFIAQYWLQFFFGLIVTGMGIVIRKVWKMYKNEQQNNKKENDKELLHQVDLKIKEQDEKMREADAKISEEIGQIKKSIDTIASGVLSIQGQTFRQTCRRLLEPSHIITIEEFEQVTRDHGVYNSLGGNSIGDAMYEQVKKKFSNQTPV